jgi:DNA-binding SARP family transcriptional activator
MSVRGAHAVVPGATRDVHPLTAWVGTNCRELSLFGGFSLRVAGTRIPLPTHAERVLAYLSVHKLSYVDCDRRMLAERLWPDSPPHRSRASLRTAIWRIRGADSQLLQTYPSRVALSDAVTVDVHDFRRRADELLAAGAAADPTARTMLPNPADLLPGWDEDWLTLTREQLRLLRLHALEQRAAALSANGHYAQAIDLILGVIHDEPLRESAHAVLIGAYLGEGNMIEARRQLATFARDLWAQLRMRPSARLVRLVSGNLPN